MSGILARSVLRVRNASPVQKGALASVAAVVGFVGYHEGRFHYHHRRIVQREVRLGEDDLNQICSKALHGADDFMQASKFYRHAWVTRALESNGLYKHDLFVGYAALSDAMRQDP
jgi:hypothetical protein